MRVSQTLFPKNRTKQVKSKDLDDPGINSRTTAVMSWVGVARNGGVV